MVRKGLLLISVLAVSLLALAQNALVSTSADTKGVSLTIYSQNFGVVREKRDINLKQGLNTVLFQDVPISIDPTSVTIKSLTAPNALTMREQDFLYDALNSTSILDKSVGKTIKLRRTLPNGQVELVEGVLLNPPTAILSGLSPINQGMVVRLKDGSLLVNPVGEVVLDVVPEGLIARPTLMWQLDAGRGGSQTIEVGFIANNLSWRADYVAVVNQAETAVDLNGLVTLDNHSGATYRDTQLQLLAGDVRRVSQGVPPMPEYGVAMMRAGAPEAPQFQEQAFSDYHLYTLEGKTTLRDNETKQLNFMSAKNVKVNRKFVMDLGRRVFTMRGVPGEGGETQEGRANIVFELKNSKENNMGIPMPRGRVRAYKLDENGNLQLLGEDQIDHTPRDQTIRLYIGDAFDVVGERVHTNHNQISDRIYEDSYKITVTNRKTVPSTVMVVEHLSGDWQITESSQKYNKLDAYTVEFPTTVPANSKVVVSYTVRVKF